MFTAAYKRYVLGALMGVSAINVMDRGLMGLLLQPIKQDLGLSDSNLGFLTGIAFGLFYATLGLPIARWADRGNRVTILSAAIALWGVTVMLMLFVTSFVQLVAARIAAAVGESGGMPPTYSLVGDYFPAATERTRAMTVYVLADPVSVLLSYLIGGWINQHYGWRVAFFVIGAPALLIAAIIRLTVVEPRESKVFRESVKARQPPLGEVLSALWRQSSSRHLIVGIVLLFTMGLGLGPWEAAFLVRAHGLDTEQLGLWLGLILSVSGIVGILLGGQAAVRWFSDDEGGQMRWCAIVIACQIPCLALFVLVPRAEFALLALVPLIAAFNAIFGPVFALLQRLVADRSRATTMAVVMLLANLIGMGIGPQMVGVLSDLLRPKWGIRSLGYAMLVMSLVAGWSAMHFWKVSKTVKGDLARVLAQGAASV